MEVDCDIGIGGKECQGKKELIRPNVENKEEGKTMFHPSDMDKMLQDCHKYLHECEEVLQDCAKYFEQCDDNDDEDEDEDADLQVDLTSDNKDCMDTSRNDDDQVTNNGTDKSVEHIPNQDNSKELIHQITKEMKETVNKEETNVMSNGIDNHSNTASVEMNKNNNNTKDADSQKDDTLEDINHSDICEDLDINLHLSDKEENGECVEPEAVTVNIPTDHSESESENDEEMVPLRIQEECDEDDKNVDNEIDIIKSTKSEEIQNEMLNPDRTIEKELTQPEDVSEKHGMEEVDIKPDVDSQNEITGSEQVPTEINKDGDGDRIKDDNVFKQDICKSSHSGDTNGNISSESKSSTDKTEEQSKSSIDNTEEPGLDELKQKEEVYLETTKQNATLQTKMTVLEEELTNTKLALKNAQRFAAEHQAKTNNIVMTLKLDLYKSQAALKKEKAQSQQKLSDIISHLTLLEGNLRRSQMKRKREIKAKNETIAEQKTEILKLRDQNEQLLNAIKEIYANGGMNGYMREKKGQNGKLGMVKDKLLMKNRSSLELNYPSQEKISMRKQRLYSSQEDLNTLHDDAFGHNSPGHEKGGSGFMFGKLHSSMSRGSKNGNKANRKNLQNFFTESDMPRHEMNKSSSDSSQISEASSGVFSMSDQELSKSMPVGGYGNEDQFNDDDDDDDNEGHIFSFSSTHINTVIDEEETLGHMGQMMSMGSMPMLAKVGEDMGHTLHTQKDRPHSLSSVDIASIQRQAEKLSKIKPSETIDETSVTPPPSPSYNNNNKQDSGKMEMTPFQTFKTMFKRKGSKNKGNKKRSVSLSQTTNNEYSEALKKHFQKYDMH